MFKYLILFIILILTPPAWANDTVAAAATGNIVFETAPELIIQDETLTISKSASKRIGADKFIIDVDFHIKNISDHDVTRKIVFVLPPVKCSVDANTMWRGFDSEESDQVVNPGLKDFATTVDDKPQTMIKRSEAMLGKQNVTEILNKLNIPLNPCKIQMTSDGLPESKYAQSLKQNHLLTEINEPAWVENIYFEWTQTFPAGKVVHIHHHYTPVTGASVLSPRGLNELNNHFVSNVPPMTPIWNKNPAALEHSHPKIVFAKNNLDPGSNQKRFCLEPMWVEYHLTTGANWKGGIKLFKLIINNESNSPFAVNKFFQNNDEVKQTLKENKMIFEISNFIPKQNLNILFLGLPENKEDLKQCGI